MPGSLQTVSVFSSSPFSILLLDTVAHQVPELVRHPVSERIIGYIAISIDEYGSAREVSEHRTGVSSGHMEVVGPGVCDVLPVRNKDDAKWKNLRVHDLDLASYERFFSGRSPLAVYLEPWCEFDLSDSLRGDRACAHPDRSECKNGYPLYADSMPRHNGPP